MTRRRKLGLAFLAVVAVLLGLAAWTVLQTEEPGPASVDEALERLQAEGDQGGPDGGRQPPQGVYLYEGEGRESLSFPPLRQRDGDQMPATVTHEDAGCWTFRIDFNANHWQSWTYCPTDEATMAEVAGASGQAWDLGVSTVGNTADFACDPPNPIIADLEPGESVAHSCTGTNSAVSGETVSAGTLTFVGEETLVVGGDEVAVLHFRNRRTLTGSQEGPERAEAWFRPDGLLVRYERDIEVRTASPVGHITYTEVGHLQLTDLEPRGLSPPRPPRQLA